MKRLTYDEIIDRFHEIYGDKYVYTKFTPKNIRERITIICPTHGTFTRTIKEHLNGKGCQKCVNETNNYTHFVEESKKRFGDVFDFPNLKEEYKDSHSKITIVCKKCGNIFTKIANDHISSKDGGCKQCRKKKIEKPIIKEKKQYISPKKYSIEKVEQLLQETILKTNEKFIYDLCNYNGMNKPITFTCNKCGKQFKRSITNFVYYNQSCPFCGEKPRNKPYTTEEFIEKSKTVFKRDDWSYECTEYKGTDKPIFIHCHALDEFGNEHGIFETTPHAHIGSMHSGCPKCSGKYGSLDRFLLLANKLYGDYYNYDKTVYNGAFGEIIVTCPVHGDFITTPNKFLNGQTCPFCSASSLEQQIIGLLKEHNIEFIFRTRKHTLPWIENLELDFFLPKYNIAIECQGLHHFKEIKFYKKKTLKDIQLADSRKKQLCEENGVKLLYFSDLGIVYPYQVYEDKEELLKEILKNDTSQ